MSKKDKQKNFKAIFQKPGYVNEKGVIISVSNGVVVPKNRKGERLFDQALREFKRIVKDSNVLDEYKSRQEFIKSSARKRKLKQDAIRLNKMMDSDTDM